MMIIQIFICATIVFSGSMVNCQDQKPSDKLLKELGDTVNEWLKVTEQERAQKFSCPPSVPDAKPEAPECTSLLDCSDNEDELCCFWAATDSHHCLKGVPKQKTIHQGRCPTLTMYNDACIPLYAGCQSDNNCGLTEKCCQGYCDNYKECLDIRQNLGCPIKLGRGGKSCKIDAECNVSEKCCGKDGKSRCVTGVSTIAKPGYCPPASISAPRSRRPSSNGCRRAYQGDCNHDNECQGSEKCCRLSCSYNQCLDLGQSTREFEDDIIANNLNIKGREKTADVENGADNSNKDLISLLMRALEAES